MQGLVNFSIMMSMLLMSICLLVLATPLLFFNMVKRLADMPLGSFFRLYNVVEDCIYRYAEYDHLRDLCYCFKYFKCGLVEIVHFPPVVEVYER